MAEETVLLRVQLDEGKTTDRLKQLTLDLDANRSAQKELTKARKEESITADEYATRLVELQKQQRTLRTEQTGLTKNLDLYNRAVRGVGGSYDQTQAQLSLAQRQYQQLADSAENSTEETQALSKVIGELRGTLKTTDGGMGLFVRNVGNYQGAVEPLIAELKRLELQQKGMEENSPTFQQQQMRIVGFQQAINKAGAEAGLTYEQTQAKLKSYGDSIAPVVQDLVQLEQQQAKVGEGSEEYARIGFRIQQVKKELTTVPKELPEIKVPTGSFRELTAELVKIRAEQKGLAEDSDAYKELEHKATAYGVAVQVAGAKAGLSYEETQKTVAEYTTAIEGATAELVKLEAEQAKVAEGSEEYNKLSFQIEGAKQKIADAVPETESFAEALLKAAGETDTLGGAVQQATGFQEKYAQAQNLVRLAMGNATGAAGVLRVAMLAIPIFAVIAALGVLYSFFTRTREGSDFVARKMAALSAVMDTLANFAADAGKALFDAFQNPKQALEDLVDGIGNRLMNQLRGFGVIVDGILNMNPRKIADGFIQAGTGITDATTKVQNFGKTVVSAATQAERLAQLQQQLTRDTEDNIDTNKRLLNEVERLKNVRDNEFNSLAVRRKANEDAYKVEIQRENTLATLAQRRVDLLRQQLALAGGRDRNEAMYKELKEAENELYDIREDAAGKQNELITNRYSLEKEGQDALKEAAEKAAEARRKELQVQIGLLDLELEKVQQNSEEELNILRRKLATQHKLDLAQKDLTTREKFLIDQKYEAASQKLTEDAAQRRVVQGLDNVRTLLNAQLAATEEGSEQQLQLQRELIENQLQQELAALDKKQDNTAKEAELRANAAKAQADLEFNQALTNLENELQTRRNLVNQEYASGLTTKQQQEAGLLAIERAGLQARLVAQQDYGRSTLETEAQIAEADAAAKDKKLADDKAREDKKRAIEDARLQAAQAVTDSVIELFGEETAAGQAALALKKAAALAEIAINLQRELSAIGTAAAANPLNIPTAGIAGISQNAILSAIAIAKAAVLSAKVLVFRDGGIAQGPSHEQGGIPLFSRRTGRAVGIEIEGGEPVLTAGVSRSPALLAVASAINVAAGGRPLVARTITPMRHMAFGGVTSSALVRDSLRGDQPAINYDLMAQAFERVNIYTKTQETMASMDKVKYVQQLSND